MPQTEDWTVGRLLQWTTEYLTEHGADTPRLDAEVLLAEARGCQRIDLYTAFDQPAGETVRVAFRELVRRRAEGTPVAYLVGRREFYSLSFRVTPDVLIPRPETEFVVVSLLDRIEETSASDGTVEIADVGTGSGIIAVCAAKYIGAARVTAVDISEAALNVARANATDHGVSDKIDFVLGDLLADLPAERRFDFVLSNPPYVGENELDQLAREVREQEPRLALVAGPTGTEVIERLIPQAAERLRGGGWLIMEIGPAIHQRTLALLNEDGRFEPASTVNDLAKQPRVVVARRGGQ